MVTQEFNVPFVANIPIELEQELNKRVKTDVSYIKLREERIKKTYNNKNPTGIRKVGEYLLNNFSKELSYEEIGKKLKMSKELAKLYISDLNFWGEYPLQMIPVPKKKGWIKSCLKDPEDTYKFLKRKSRTIASMEQVYTNTEVRVRIKEKPQRKKVEVKQKSKNKKEKEE